MAYALMKVRIVMPVEMGIQSEETALWWIPASAGMTICRHARGDGHPIGRNCPLVDSRIRGNDIIHSGLYSADRHSGS
jgi:hypothetical protein